MVFRRPTLVDLRAARRPRWSPLCRGFRDIRPERRHRRGALASRGRQLGASAGRLLTGGGRRNRRRQSPVPGGCVDRKAPALFPAVVSAVGRRGGLRRDGRHGRSQGTCASPRPARVRHTHGEGREVLVDEDVGVRSRRTTAASQGVSLAAAGGRRTAGPSRGRRQPARLCGRHPCRQVGAGGGAGLPKRATYYGDSSPTHPWRGPQRWWTVCC